MRDLINLLEALGGAETTVWVDVRDGTIIPCEDAAHHAEYVLDNYQEFGIDGDDPIMDVAHGLEYEDLIAFRPLIELAIRNGYIRANLGPDSMSLESCNARDLYKAFTIVLEARGKPVSTLYYDLIDTGSSGVLKGPAVTEFWETARLPRITETVLKLGSKTSPGLEGFMTDYRAMTSDHPINGRARLSNNASMEIYPFNGMIHIGDILALEPGKGCGREALELLCKLADKHSVKLDLTAKAYGDLGRLSTQQLHDWYERYGFADDEDSFGDEHEGFDMVRHPKFEEQLHERIMPERNTTYEWRVETYRKDTGEILTKKDCPSNEDAWTVAKGFKRAVSANMGIRIIDFIHTTVTTKKVRNIS